MNIIGVIPARYQSSRFPGKPLADLYGKPMIWWVYNQAKKVSQFSDVIVATDDERIIQKCNELDIHYVLTSQHHPNHIHRIQEVSETINADFYVCINGDEPIIEPEAIETLINNITNNANNNGAQVFGLMRVLTDPAETVDFANIKIVTNDYGEAMYMSRSPIPYPRGTLNFKYKKYVGVEGFNKEALDFFVSTDPGSMETIEDIDHLRFLENGYKIIFSLVDSNSLSVDTPKDLEKVKSIISKYSYGRILR